MTTDVAVQALKAAGTWGGASGLVFALAYALINMVVGDVRIAIDQANTQGLTQDVQARQLSGLTARVAELEAERNQGPRYTAQQGGRVEDRVRRLEDFHLGGGGGVDAGSPAGRAATLP